MKLRTILLTAALTLGVTPLHADPVECYKRAMHGLDLSNAYNAWIQDIIARDSIIQNKIDNETQHTSYDVTKINVSTEELKQLISDYTDILTRMKAMDQVRVDNVRAQCSKEDKIREGELARAETAVVIGLAKIQDILAHKQ